MSLSLGVEKVCNWSAIDLGGLRVMAAAADVETSIRATQSNCGIIHKSIMMACMHAKAQPLAGSSFRGSNKPLEPVTPRWPYKSTLHRLIFTFIVHATLSYTKHLFTQLNSSLFLNHDPSLRHRCCPTLFSTYFRDAINISNGFFASNSLPHGNIACFLRLEINLDFASVRKGPKFYI